MRLFYSPLSNKFESLDEMDSFLEKPIITKIDHIKNLEQTSFHRRNRESY